ncbi:MAG: hypothetical protein MZV70_65025 [Desulfobacterales bacterium]|nr:hypothetical protein [Desulfobacterales bacterium]
MMKNGNSLTVIQLNDSHAYFDLHQEMFWQGGQAVYRPAGGYARIATLVKQIRAANQERVLFCDCGDTLQGTYPALEYAGTGNDSCFEFIGPRRDDGPLGICLWSRGFQAARSGAQLFVQLNQQASETYQHLE